MCVRVGGGYGYATYDTLLLLRLRFKKRKLYDSKQLSLLPADVNEAGVCFCAL